MLSECVFGLMSPASAKVITGKPKGRKQKKRIKNPLWHYKP
ncbi:MAG: hypothetical protein V1768_00610 [Patescibacteria group bacterium]